MTENVVPDWLRGRFEDLDESTFADWMCCPNCRQRSVTLRRDKRDSEIVLLCTECGVQDVFVWGETDTGATKQIHLGGSRRGRRNPQPDVLESCPECGFEPERRAPSELQERRMELFADGVNIDDTSGEWWDVETEEIDTGHRVRVSCPDCSHVVHDEEVDSPVYILEDGDE